MNQEDIHPERVKERILDDLYQTILYDTNMLFDCFEEIQNINSNLDKIHQICLDKLNYE